MKRRIGLCLTVLHGVRIEIALAVRLFCAIVPEFVRIEHYVPITLTCTPTVATKTGAGFGAFEWHRGKCQIYVCGNPDRREGFIGSVVDTLSHELAHYEQWRDGRQPSERGVGVRARSISKRFHSHPLAQDAEAVIRKAMSAQ